MINYIMNDFVLAESLDDLINAIVEADNRGVTLAPMADGSNGNNVSVPSWSFGQSFFFASTVVTTIGNGSRIYCWRCFGSICFIIHIYIYISLQCIISLLGYGHQSPLSTSGKVFCMVYALIGIPMTMVLLTAVVERLLIPATALLKWMNTNLGHLHTPFFIRVLHLILVSFRVFIIWIFLIG